MSTVVTQTSIDQWIAMLSANISEHHPELTKVFETYAGEAVFGRNLIGENLALLTGGARVIEIGAGALILSTQLVREGFDVIAVEPVESGFSHFNALQNVVVQIAKQHQCLPKIVKVHAEELSLGDKCDFAFSINVMEHVDDPVLVVKKVVKHLKPQAVYRFVCPNYTFPYEPHFNIPTIINKRITEKLLKNKIFYTSNVLDPEGTWESLNWINVGMMKQKFNNDDEADISFNPKLLVTMFERAVTDKVFLARRPKWLTSTFSLIVKLRLHNLISKFPTRLQPIMDCSVKIRLKE